MGIFATEKRTIPRVRTANVKQALAGARNAYTIDDLASQGGGQRGQTGVVARQQLPLLWRGSIFVVRHMHSLLIGMYHLANVIPDSDNIRTVDDIGSNTDG